MVTSIEEKEQGQNETEHEHHNNRETFSLRAFSEMTDTKSTSIIPQDLYHNPPSVVELTTGSPQTLDDTAVIRMTMGKMAKTAAFESNQKATSTTPRRPNDKYYMCPTNTFIASNGDVYEIEPFMLPPPTEIAALFRELKSRRERSESDMSAEKESVNSRPRFMNIKDNLKSNGQKKSDEKPPISNNQILPRNYSFDSTTSEVFPVLNEKILKEAQLSFRRKPVDEKSKQWPHIIGQDESENENSEKNHIHFNPSVSESENNEKNSYVRNSKRYRNDMDLTPPPRKNKQDKQESSIGAYPTFLRTDQRQPKDEEFFIWENFSLYKYLMTEMLGVGESGHLHPTAVGNMDNFLTVPSKVERFIEFGFFICVDAFLYVITFLPIRVGYSLYLLVKETLGYLWWKGGGIKRGGREGYFHRSHLYDLMRGGFMLLSCVMLQQLNMSRVYHYIRGQTLIKLYVLTAMLEIFDKLLCSFGQDAFDSLYCITRMRPEPRRILFAFIITAIYTTLHSMLYFMLVATLTVAINSSDQALVTVLVLNNFAEIKSFVFKKFDKQNLFQLSCSDITERFQLVIIV